MKLLRIPGTVFMLLLSLLAISLSTSVPLAWAKVGTITEFPISTACPPSSFACLPQGITLGPDGKMWFTETGGEKIGRITTAGVITEFTIPTANSQPFGIASGRGNKVWFTEAFANQIGSITIFE